MMLRCQPCVSVGEGVSQSSLAAASHPICVQPWIEAMIVDTFASLMSRSVPWVERANIPHGVAAMSEGDVTICGEMIRQLVCVASDVCVSAAMPCDVKR